MSGAKHRSKGNRVEREIVERHRALHVRAERYPLSGASRFRGSGHDVDIYAFGIEQAPLVAEVKARKDGAGFTTLEKWLGEYDLLFLRRNHGDPLVVMPWRVWERIVRDNTWQPDHRRPLLDGTSAGLAAQGVEGGDNGPERKTPPYGARSGI
jgi:Holliday junction resolvase